MTMTLASQSPKLPLQLKLALVLSTSCAILAPANAQLDLFCFAGQSNALGWTLGGQSISGDESFLVELISALDDPGVDNSALAAIIEPYHVAKNVYDATVVDTEAFELMDLSGRGLVSALTTALDDATYNLIGGKSGAVNVSLVNEKSMGISYGPEYMFTRVMQAEYGYATPSGPLEIRKAARGGTRIYDGWSPTRPGDRWDELRRSIVDAPAGTFQGFVWFQGENDCLHDSSYQYYYGNLTELVTSVRQLMFDHSPEGSWDQPRSIPVVIVQVGYWPGPDGEGYATVTSDQADFAEMDGCSALVTTNDLCRFFHFDPPSQLIIGERVAKAMASLSGCTANPTAVPTKLPSLQPSNTPSSTQPSSSPSSTPSSSPPTPLPISPTYPSISPSSSPSSIQPVSPCGSCLDIADRAICEGCVNQCTWSGGNGPNGQCSSNDGGGAEPTATPISCTSTACDFFDRKQTCEDCSPTCIWENQRGTQFCAASADGTNAVTAESNIFVHDATDAPTISGFVCGSCSGLNEAICSDCGDCIWKGKQCVPW